LAAGGVSGDCGGCGGFSGGGGGIGRGFLGGGGGGGGGSWLVVEQGTVDQIITFLSVSGCSSICQRWWNCKLTSDRLKKMKKRNK
jgi:hypothetical protein